MKKFYAKLAVALLFLGSSNTKAQVFPESFEGSFPPTGWVFYDNGIGTAETWTNSSTAQSGSLAAYIQYENVSSGIAEDWLVTPSVAIAATSSILSFWERETYTTNWGSIYSILVSTSSQTNTSTFTVVATYPENTTNPLVYKNRIINLGAYSGQNLYIAFRMENDDGDDWLLDDIQLTGGCIIPPMAGVISGTANTTYGNTNQYTVSPVTGNIQWLSGSSPTGPWTAIAGATNTPQNITAAMGGTMYLMVVASSTVGGCLDDTTNTPLAVLVDFPGDNSCNALPLTIGPSSVYYQFMGASVETGEVQPPAGSCSSQQTWCNNTLDNTRWFTFVAPSSGHVIIHSPDFDTQLAVWKSASCSGLLSSSTATFVCGNDDDPDYTTNGGVQYSSYLHAGCLTPGATYYLQVDSYSPAASSDSTRVIITDAVTPLDASFTGLNTVYCMPGASSTSLTPVSQGGIFTLNTSTASITTFSPPAAGPGTHTVYLTVSGCISSSVTSVVPNPTVNSTSTSSLLCAGQSATLSATGATTYSWSTGGTGSSIVVSPSVTTTYSVTGSTSGCSTTTTIVQSVSACTNVNEIAANTGISIYPNPNNGLFTLNADQVPDEVLITDILGKKVYSAKPASKSSTIDIRPFNQGLYFVTIKSANSTFIIKIIKD